MMSRILRFPISGFLPNVFLSLALSALGCPAQDQSGGPAVKSGNQFGIPSEPAAPPEAPKGPKTTSGPGWDAVRAVLTNPDNCYGGKAEYCVKDADFVDPLIQGVLDKWYDGVMPTDASKIEAVGKSAKSRYLEALQSPDGMRRIEKLVEERFSRPDVTKKGDAVILDFGFVPQKLGIFRNRLAATGPSEHLDGNQWKSSEIGQAFKKAVAENPQAKAITLLVDVYSNSTSPRWTYLYDKVADRIVVFTPATMQGAYLTKALNHDFDAIIAGKTTLQTGQLTYDRAYTAAGH